MPSKSVEVKGECTQPQAKRIMTGEEVVEQATAQIIDRCVEKKSYPMWTVTDKVSKLQPNPKALPTVWHWGEMRPILLDSAAIVPEEQAERRALMLVNPGFGETRGPSPYTTDTLYAGFQMVLPGETAPAHRHMAYAVRLILESDKGFTTVAGQKIYLEPGDLVLTPSWEWHYHGNDGSTPTLWVDCLDIPLHVFAHINFLELYPTKKIPDLVTTDSPFHFSWKAAKQALDSQKLDRAVYHYLRNGNYFSHTIACQSERLSRGSVSVLPRETNCYIYVVQSGRGSTKITAPTGEALIEWGPKDVFIVPAWSWIEHRCGPDEDAYLTALTDRAFGDSLGLSRITYPPV